MVAGQPREEFSLPTVRLIVEPDRAVVLMLVYFFAYSESSVRSVSDFSTHINEPLRSLS